MARVEGVDPELVPFGTGKESHKLAFCDGISGQPKELVRISRRWAEARFSNLVHSNELEASGHFAALEQPVLLTEEIRAAFRELRA